MGINDFPGLKRPLIISTKGLPCTAKSEFATIIGKWAKCPVFYIDHFLDPLSLEKDYTAELLPSPEEAERLHCVAFDLLCKAASDSLQWGVDNPNPEWGYKCVVVKSRLCSNFQIDRLLQLGRERGCGTILIIEFRVKNEYRFQLRLEQKVELGRQKEWYKPRSWNDIEKAKDDYEATHNNWDLHLRRLLDSSGDDLPQVTKVVLDPFDDLFLVPVANLPYMTRNIFNFLLSKVEVGSDDSYIEGLFLEGRYAVVQYGEVGQYWREMRLRGPRSNSAPLICYSGEICKFKCWEVDRPINCWVCGECINSSQPTYGCQFCTITVHKSCVELARDFTLDGYQHIQNLSYYPIHLSKRHACKFCRRFSDGCKSCYLQTHLNCRVLPTILNHDGHHHSLSIMFSFFYKCKACGKDRDQVGGSYGCYICDKNYDIECLSLVRGGEHEHGGHIHLLKLIYSREGMDEEEAYWCDICYEDIDPQNWFYSCQYCPDFSAHPNCAKHSIINSSKSSLLDLRSNVKEEEESEKEE